MGTHNLPFKAIQTFKQAGIINDGLTIPFLVGIYHKYYPIDLFSSKCVETIINDIVNDSDKQKYLLTKCGNFREYVLLVPDDVIDTGLCFTNTQGCKILYLDMYFPKPPNSIDELIAYLYNEYREIIMAEKFSKRGLGEWESFTHEEQALIDEILAQN